jgi:hypothetical protein
MDRRALLLALASAPVAGCVSDPDPNTGDDTTPDTSTERPNETETPTETQTPTETETPDGEYERCHLVEIRYEWLPDGLQEEVDEALDGGYESEEGPTLTEAIDVESSYIVVDEQPYEPWADADSDGWVLELNEVEEIRLPEPRELSVENGDERPHEVTITLDRDGDRMVEETLSLDSGEERTVEATDVFGSYDLCAETDEHGEECFGFRVSDSYFEGLIEVSEDGIFLTQAVAEMEPCP